MKESHLRLVLLLVASSAWLRASAGDPPVRAQVLMFQVPVFEDVASASGLTVSHISSPEQRYILESMSGGLGFLDHDHDEDLDLVVVNGSTVERFRKGGDPLVTLYRQDAPLTFVDVTAEAGLTRRGWGMGVAAGDYDNDGRIDLYVTGYGGNALYRNRGDGTFIDATDRAGVRAEGFSTGAAWGDYDRDGHLDLFVARYVSVDDDRLPEFGKDDFCRFKGINVQCGPGGLPGESDLLFRNRGDGTFEEISDRAGVSDPQKLYGLGAMWADYDDDGWLDLFVANDTNPNYLYRNRGDGTFEDASLLSGTALSGDGAAQGCMGIDFGDFDRDGRFDLFVTNFSEQPNALYRNLGAEGFLDVSWSTKSGPPGYFQVGWGTDFFDADLDGWPDLLTVNGHVYPQIDVAEVGTKYRQPLLFQRNDRDGTFTDITAESGLDRLPLASRRGAAFGDVDQDGDIDVAILNVGEPPTLLRNRMKGGHRVLLDLVGRASNRSAVGTRVALQAGDLIQIDEVRAGASYLSQNDRRLHFGLGSLARIDEIAIRWPNGRTEHIRDLGADRLYTVVEGGGVQDSRPLEALR